jgi:hypothetical protein
MYSATGWLGGNPVAVIVRTVPGTPDVTLRVTLGWKDGGGEATVVMAMAPPDPAAQRIQAHTTATAPCLLVPFTP